MDSQSRGRGRNALRARLPVTVLCSPGALCLSLLLASALSDHSLHAAAADALLPTETSGTSKGLRTLAHAVLILLTLTVVVLGIVKGLAPGRHGLIIVSIVLLPLLGSTWMLLRWTSDESIDERLARMATFQAVMIVALDIALMVAMLDKPTC